MRTREQGNISTKICLEKLMLVCVLIFLQATSYQLQATSFKLQAKTNCAGDAYKYIKEMAKIGVRYPGSKGQIEFKNYLLKELQKYNKKSYIQKFDQTVYNKAFSFFNLISVFEPKIKTNKKGLIFCTHWDSRPWADNDPDPKNHKKPIIGANDGLSGTALLMSLIKNIDKIKFNRKIAFVFFDGEDMGKDGENWVLGSTYFAETFDFKDYEFGILIDMVGEENLNIYREQFSEMYAKKYNDYVFNKARALKLKAFFNYTKHSVIDDHVPMLKKGFPCIDLIDFDYEYWHTMADTIDKISVKSLWEISHLIVSIIEDEIKP
ncbi:MAG: M28 family peptidase [Pseudomonadota bacterium]